VVSEGSPFQGSGPFSDLLRDLARLLSGQGPVNWEVARQLAAWTASEGQAEPNPDPLSRMRTEELLRVAAMHVAEATGLATSRRGWLSLRPVTRSEWATTTLGSWREVVLALAAALSPGLEGGLGTAGSGASRPGAPEGGVGSGGPGAPEGGVGSGGPGAPEGGPANPMEQLIGNLPQVVGPLLLGVQVGTMVGHLARRAMGQYDFLMPAPEGDELLAVPSVVDAFAKEWGLSADDVRMYVCLRDVAHHAVFSRPHVGAAFRRHLLGYASAFRVEPSAIEERLAGIDPADPMSFQRSLGDPEAVLADLQTDEQRRLLVPFRAFLAAMAGYTDFVIDEVGRKLVGSYALVAEAYRRWRLEDTPGQRALGKLLGVEVDQAVLDKGHAFVAGVLERAGKEGLGRLWESEATLPTPPELEAPGLWLARIELG
jgi:putative hydrolase